MLLNHKLLRQNRFTRIYLRCTLAPEPFQIGSRAMAAKMAPTIRPDMVKTFSGEGDVEAWLAKVELVAKLTSIDDVASFIPLYLEGEP